MEETLACLITGIRAKEDLRKDLYSYDGPRGLRAEPGSLGRSSVSDANNAGPALDLFIRELCDATPPSQSQLQSNDISALSLYSINTHLLFLAQRPNSERVSLRTRSSSLLYLTGRK
jgi:hypothetical protein